MILMQLQPVLRVEVAFFIGTRDLPAGLQHFLQPDIPLPAARALFRQRFSCRGELALGVISASR